MAPSFANLYMAEFEDEFIYTYRSELEELWFRFIDDCFLLWPFGRQELNTFLEYLNDKAKKYKLKFTHEISETGVPFLDTFIYLDENNDIQSRLYTKPTDTHDYLRYDSAHPKSTKDAIPYGQFLRVRRICSKLEEFDKSSMELSAHFIRRGYPEKLVREAYLKARQKNRDDLLNQPTKNKKKSDGLFFITTFNPQNPPIRESIKKNWPILADNASTRQTLLPKQVTFGYRRPKNLRDTLVRAKVSKNPPPITIIPGTSNVCSKKQCKICPKIQTSGKIKSQNTGIEYEIKHHVSCESSNLIYVMTCKQCKMQYVGQTKRTLGERFSEHFRDIKNKSPKLLCVHLNSREHHGTDDISIAVLSFIKQTPNSLSAQKARDKMEMFWYNQLGTMVPRGLNVEKTAKKSYQ